MIIVLVLVYFYHVTSSYLGRSSLVRDLDYDIDSNNNMELGNDDNNNNNDNNTNTF